MTDHIARTWAFEITGVLELYLETVGWDGFVVTEDVHARAELLRKLRNAHEKGYRLAVTVNGETGGEEA